MIGVAIDLVDEPGALANITSVLAKHNISVSAIESRVNPLPPHEQLFHTHMIASWDDPSTHELISELKAHSTAVYRLPPASAPWFPRHVTDIDQFSRSTLDAGTDLESSHPGFSDQEYRKRRDSIVSHANSYSSGQRIPEVQYTEQDVQTWGTVYKKLSSLYPWYACQEHNDSWAELEKAGIYSPDRIPQLQEISEFLNSKTGFTLRPVTGLLSARDFLAALAFRVFFSTQYIRHHSAPMYTPEPDVCHELMGHVPMFANPDFAEFTQQIGLASLGASDEVVEKLATTYWFSAEFGLLWEKGEIRAYGAGVLSSYGELLHATSPTNSDIEIRPWDPFQAAYQKYPITTMQPVYYAASSLSDAKEKMKRFASQIERPFNVHYDHEHQVVLTDRSVIGRPVGLRWKAESSDQRVPL